MSRPSSSFSLSLALAAAALLLSADARADTSIWTELKAGARPTIALPSISPLVERATRASLSVMIEQDPSAMPPGHPRLPHPMPQGGQGAGFLIHPSGYAVTNFHVVEGAREIRVRVGKDTLDIPAEVVGADEKTDIALIRLKSDRQDWPHLPLGDSDRLNVGDFVVAIGNPFGLSQTVSLGILSARGRRDINPSARPRW